MRTFLENGRSCGVVFNAEAPLKRTIYKHHIEIVTRITPLFAQSLGLWGIDAAIRVDGVTINTSGLYDPLTLGDYTPERLRARIAEVHARALDLFMEAERTFDVAPLPADFEAGIQPMQTEVRYFTQDVNGASHVFRRDPDGKTIQITGLEQQSSNGIA